MVLFLNLGGTFIFTIEIVTLWNGSVWYAGRVKWPGQVGTGNEAVGNSNHRIPTSKRKSAKGIAGNVQLIGWVQFFHLTMVTRGMILNYVGDIQVILEFVHMNQISEKVQVANMENHLMASKMVDMKLL